MIDFKPVIFVNGILLIILAAAMGVPALVDSVSGQPYTAVPEWIKAAIRLRAAQRPLNLRNLWSGPLPGVSPP